MKIGIGLIWLVVMILVVIVALAIKMAIECPQARQGITFQEWFSRS
jgi:hypothetical protein